MNKKTKKCTEQNGDEETKETKEPNQRTNSAHSKDHTSF